MRVTRKMSHDMPHVMMDKGEDEEIAPSLRLSELPKEIEGLEPGKEFHGHIKGKCLSHEHGERKGMDGKKGEMRHHYELEVHHFEHDGKKEVKRKKSPHEETKEAMDKWDEENAAKKKEKEDKGKVEKQEKGE
jgi:hypothetical protein